MDDLAPQRRQEPSRRAAPEPGRDQALLGVLAAPLAPAAAPEYIRDASVPAPGWYWKRASESPWEWLGRNTQVATSRLAQLRANAGR